MVDTVAKKFTKRRHKSGIGDTHEADEVTGRKRDKVNGVSKVKKLKTQKKKFLKPQDD